MAAALNRNTADAARAMRDFVLFFNFVHLLASNHIIRRFWLLNRLHEKDPAPRLQDAGSWKGEVCYSAVAGFSSPQSVQTSLSGTDSS